MEHDGAQLLIQGTNVLENESSIVKQTTEIEIVSEEETELENCNYCKKFFDTEDELIKHYEGMCKSCVLEGRFCVELENYKTCYL